MADPASEAPDPTTGKPPRPRRWIPLSLKIFAAIIAILALSAASVGIMAYRQQAALSAIQQVGGSVEIRPHAPQWLRDYLGDERVKSLDDVIEVNLVGKQATDVTLRHASRLQGLERLLLDVTSVTDIGLGHLDGQNALHELSLSNTNITDSGLTHLRNLKNLKQLSLAGTQVTDVGISHMQGLTSLTSLSLERTRVTDAGLSKLHEFTGLQILSLDNTQFTDTGRISLDALPSLQMVWVDNRQPAVTGNANALNFDAKPAVSDLVQSLDSNAKRHHYWNHDDTNEFEETLQRIINLGGPDAEKLLMQKIKREASELDAAKERLKTIGRENDVGHSEEIEIDRLSNNLEILTALRRVQKQPDPLSISVGLPRDLKADTRSLPTFFVSLNSVDFERIPVWIQRVPHFHGTHREAQWRFEVRDHAGNLLPIRPNLNWERFEGGIKSDGWLNFGETLTTTLPMGDFIDIPKSGVYTVTILYHAKLPIADETAPRGLDYLITFRSVPFKLTVEQGPKRVIKSSRAENELALSLVGKLPSAGVVKIVGGTYDADDYEFVPPETPAGQLLTMGWRAIPALVESLSDESLSRHQKAWVLTLLYTITAERDFKPQPFDTFLPAYERRYGKDLGGSRSGGRISPSDQDAIIMRWKHFASEYLEFQIDVK